MVVGVAPSPDSAAYVRIEKEQAGSARIIQQIMAFISVALAVLAMVFFGSAVDRQLEKMRTAQISGVEWSLARSIADFREFRHGAEDLEVGDRPEGVIADFEIFRGWITRFQSEDMYEPQRGSTDFSAALSGVAADLTSISNILSSRRLNAKKLDRLDSAMTELEGKLLVMEKRGIEESRASAARLQYDAAATLARLAAFVALLLITLLLLTIYLSWQGRVLLSRARREARTATRLETILGSSEDGVIVAGRDGRVQMLGASATALLDIEEADIDQRTVDEVLGLPPEDIHDLQEASCGSVVEKEIRTRVGRTFAAEISVRLAHSSEEEIAVFFIRDITHRKDIERELIKARDEALAGQEAKANFVAVMSHEIRTPLNGIVGIVELLQDTNLDEEQKRLLGNMEVSSRILLSHLNNVLDISRAAAGSLRLAPRPADLNAVVSDVIQSLSDAASSKGNTLLSATHGDGAWVYDFDPDRMRQVLMNLVGNSQKFTSEGEISVEVERLGVREGEDIIEMRVIDTGAGIPEDKIGKIFDDFETLDTSYARNQSGAGLGLGIVKRIIEAMNGTISVDSLEGCGTQFTMQFEMTRAEKSSISTPEKKTTRTKNLVRREILVVEDNDINRSVLRGSLKKLGARVDCAENGRAGVDLARKKFYDIIFMDISMPVLDGVCATKQIREDGASRESDVIATTADISFSDKMDYKTAGFSGSISKPIARESLRDILFSEVLPMDVVGKFESACAETHDLIKEDLLSEMLEDIGRDAVAGLVRKLYREVDDFAQCMRNADDGKECAAARLHTLAGAAGTCGQMAMLSCLRNLEAAAGRSDLGREDLAHLEKIRRKSSEAFETFIDIDRE